MRTSVPLLAVAAVFLLAWTPLPSAVAPEVVLDAAPPAESFDGPASIAADGEGAFVAVSRGGSRDWDRFFYGGSLDAIGVPALDSSFIGCTDAQGRGANPVIASSGNGKGYMIVYGSAMKTYAVRFTTSGRRGETVELPAESVSDIAWDGASFVVLTGSNAFRLSETAQVLDTNIPLAGNRTASRNGVTVAIANTGNLSARTLIGGTVGQSVNIAPGGVTYDVAAGDPGFLVVYDAGGAVLGRLLDPSGNPDGFSFLIASGGKSPSAVWNGTEWTVAYEVGSAVRATRVLRGPVSQSFLIDESGYAPAVAASGSTVYITWRRSLFGGNQSATIEGEQVTPRGPAPRGSSLQTSPRLATVANVPLVVWNDGSNRARRMDGIATTQVIEQSGTPAALASRGDEALVVLMDYKTMNLVVVDALGVTKHVTSLTRMNRIQHATATWMGDSYLVVWLESLAVNGGLYMSQVSSSGEMQKPKLIAPLQSTTAGIAAATAGDTALVLWSGSSSYTAGYLIRNGAVVATKWLPAQMLTVAGDDQRNFVVARINGEILEWRGLQSDGTPSGAGQTPIGIASNRILGAFWTGENFLLSLARGGEITPGPARIELSGLRLTREAARIDEAPVLFANVFTNLPANASRMSLRNGRTLDLLYYRSLDQAGLYNEWQRLVFRSIHDSPRRRTVR